MPRIDPQQLLSCLTPLLAVNGGIKSSGEVIRLANLMEKYSKKLVSKCIYIQILKCTETDLLQQFMAAGGWNLVHTWLNDGVNSTNWPFVQEILEMLLLCPVDGNRLKSNHTPKIVKNLSLNLSQNAIITALSKKLVEQWLKIAHQEKQMLQQQQNGLNGTINFNNVNDDNKNFINTDSVKSDTELNISSPTENNDTSNINTVKNDTVDGSPKKSSENVKYKVSNKDSGLILSIKRSSSPITDDTKVSKSPDPKSKSEHKSKSSSDKDRSKKSSSSSSSHKSSSSKSSHRDKDRSSSSSSSSHKSSRSSSSKDKDKSSSSKHSSSSRDKDKDREKRKRDLEKEQAEKDKETLNFLAPLPSGKLQRIPKRQHSENSENKSESEVSSKSAKSNEVIEKKKPSMSIEVRTGDKPKTVKTLNSQFRNHGLAEEPPPPPSRKAIKKPSTTTPVILPLPTNNSSSKPISPPPTKKLHLDKALESDVPERAGGVKLIKPKPMLFESTGFLDALEVSAMTRLNKKDPKKRKRLTSGSSSTTKKEEPESPKIETKPLKFYKDTLEETAEEEKATTNGTSSASPTKDIENSMSNGTDEKTAKSEEAKPDESIEKKKSEESNKEEEPEEKRPPGIGTGVDGPPGIISDPNFPKRKRAKRSIRWRAEEDLIDVRYFELDENERVNVTKTFMEQKQDEHNRERMMLRTKVVELTEWHKPKLIDNVPDLPYGSKSVEAAIQAERERNTLQEMFFNNKSMYDSPHEADPEQYDNVEPPVIPLDDITGNPDSVNNFKDVQWPAPKGEQPQYISQGGFGSLFGNLTTALTIPPAPVNAAINPLAGFNLGGLSSTIPQDAAINFMGIIQQAALPAPFMQPPPLIQNNYQSNSNNYQSRGGSSGGGNYNRYDNNNRNRMGNSGSNSSGGSNWVRGNANMRRGMCHQYQRTGHCSKSNCPYVHER